MKTPKINPLLNNRFYPALAAVLLAAMAVSSYAQTLQCVETNGVKFLLPPNINGGLDVKASRNNIVLADDFYCNTTGPITDIHLWGSWLGDNHGTITNFWIGIYNDVPGVTNFLTGKATPSRPGTNLLWQQNFGPGQYAESIYNPASPGQEYFYNPTNNLIVGGDQYAWYYCFYPANPFIQQGTATQPTNYWLSVHAQLLEPGTSGILFGWKTSVVPYNDAAVWGTLDASGLPAGDWQSMTNPLSGQHIDLSFKLTTPTNPPTTSQCVESNGVKYVQGPNLFGGVDVWNSSSKPTQVADGPWWLADDFVCFNTGPISDIHLWGSWQNDAPLTNSITFQLYVLDDVPVNPNNPFSHPGTNVVWHQTFAPGSYAENIWSVNASESFLDPGIPAILGGDSVVWYYCFYPTNLVQRGTAAAPKTYWLVAFAEIPAGVPNVFGWKSTTNVQHDVSVHMNWTGFGTVPTNSLAWLPNYETAAGQQPLDLAFKLTTPTNPPPTQTQCIETNGVKYVQNPNLDGGLDVWNNPYVLADDFLCSTPGPITDIHLWGSWLNNLVGTNTLTFWLAIYDDVAANAANPFSHPGSLLWQQWFGPGQYAENLWGFGSESFLDPGPPQIIGNDQQAWYYCFYPTNPLVQLGSPGAPKTYWLAAYAQPPAGSTFQYGWKTTQLVKNDVSVHAPWPGSPPAANPGWQPTTYQPATGGTATPLDLAFKITTPTNHCPVPVICPADKTVECGSTWSFDPPFVGPDQCCSSNPVVNFTTVTNFYGPCQQSITRTWFYYDCIGFVGACSQTVTVEDTNPPVFTSFPTNLVAYTCDTNTAVFWFVTATDACSSVTITSTPPPNFIFRSQSTNLVSVTASDACGNTTNKTFTVAVVRPVLGLLYIRYLDLATNNYVITWTNGILQVSTATNLMKTTDVAGPYVDVPGATSPYTNTALLPAKFYRLRCN